MSGLFFPDRAIAQPTFADFLATRRYAHDLAAAVFFPFQERSAGYVYALDAFIVVEADGSFSLTQGIGEDEEVRNGFDLEPLERALFDAIMEEAF